MLHKSVRIALFLLLAFSAITVLAQEEPAPANPSLEFNNLYRVENQWGGADADWHPGGLWVLGGRAGQPVTSVNFESADEGVTLEGEITYANEGPITFWAKQEYANTYYVEVQWGGADAPWNPDGLWVIGSREDQAVVAANLTLAEDGNLVGEITYAGEGPIAFWGAPVDGGVFYTENQWGSTDSDWNMGGIWVIGGRADQQVVALSATSTDEGVTLEGEMTYAGEGPIAFWATQWVGNVYYVENQWGGADADWHAGGYWVLGGRSAQRIVGIDITAADGALEGTITYAGEGPIRFASVALQALNAALGE